MTDNAERADTFMSLAHDVIAAAESNGVVLRLCGGLAIWNRCEQSRPLQMRRGRLFSDVDLAAHLRDKQRVESCFRTLGCAIDAGFATVPGLRRSQFTSTDDVTFDVYYDVLAFCHEVDLRKRLESDTNQITIPLAELLLQKLQIVELTDKDVVDAQALLFSHPLASSDEEGINSLRLVGLCSRDWGLCRTISSNLQKIIVSTDADLSLSPSQRDVIVQRLRKLDDAIVRAPKSVGWRMRSIVGTRVRWYTPVEPAASTYSEGMVGRGE